MWGRSGCYRPSPVGCRDESEFGVPCDILSGATRLHGITDRSDPAHRAALDQFREQSLTDLADVRWLFSGTHPAYHTTILNDGLWHMASEEQPDITLATMIEQFWNHGTPDRNVFEQAAQP